MMSVGAEKDPYLQAYIQARMKNHVEEVKLQKVLANLEMGRRIKKIMLNMELFEDRKMAHKFKQEVSDAETNKKKAMAKFLHSQKKIHRTKKEALYKSHDTAHSLNASLTADTFDNIPTTAPTSGTTKRNLAIYPVTKGNVRASSPGGNKIETVSSASRVELRRVPSTDHTTPTLNNNTSNNNYNHHPQHQNGGTNNHVTINTQTSGVRVRELTAPVRRESSVSLFKGNHNSHNNNNNNLNNSLNNSQTTNYNGEDKLSASVRRQSTMPHLSTPSVHVETFDADGIKTPATIPMRRGGKRAPTDMRSVRTLPILLHSQSSTSILGAKTTRPQTSKLWPGDPDAIRSVRRERRKPEEMLSLVKNGEEARRMIRDMPPTCSKNCSKPDILHELGRSYSDLPNLLPAIEKARHAFALKEAANRESPPDNAEGDESSKDVYPVSQIQYLALRSMGGVRRNSVIA